MIQHPSSVLHEGGTIDNLASVHDQPFHFLQIHPNFTSLCLFSWFFLFMNHLFNVLILITALCLWAQRQIIGHFGGFPPHLGGQLLLITSYACLCQVETGAVVSRQKIVWESEEDLRATKWEYGNTGISLILRPARGCRRWMLDLAKTGFELSACLPRMVFSRSPSFPRTCEWPSHCPMAYDKR